MHRAYYDCLYDGDATRRLRRAEREWRALKSQHPDCELLKAYSNLSQFLTAVHAVIYGNFAPNEFTGNF